MAKRYKRSAPQRQQKVNPQLQGITIIDGMPQPRKMPQNYRSYAREGYGGNDTLFKVINYAITNGAAIPPVLYTDKTMSKRIDSHPLLDKLARPNPEMTGVFFRKAVIGYFLISGNSFMYMNRLAQSGPADELWTLPPDRVHPIPDKTKGIIGYEYEDWPKEKNPIPPQLIGHLRSWNPDDPFFGMSPIQVASIMVDQQTDAREWNLSLFQNFLKPPGAWTTTAILSPNDRAKTEARINEKMAGYRNAGKVPLLDGALKFESSAVNPSEMDWLESMKYNAGSIANIYNMPPPLIGDTSATTYDNYEQAEIVSYTEFIFPTLDDFYGVLNMWQVPLYPDLCDKKGNPVGYLYYDKETVEVVQKVMQAQKDAKSDRANKLWLSGMAMQDEARELAGLPKLPNGAGKVFRFGTVLVPADKMMEYAEQSLKTAPPPPEPLPLPGDEPPDNEQMPPEKRQQAMQTKALDLSTTEEKAAYMASLEAKWQHWETEYAQQIAAYFELERKAVVDALNASISTGSAAGRAEGAINEQSSKLKKILLSLYEDVAVDVGGDVADTLTSTEQKGAFREFVKLFGERQVKYLLLMAGTQIKQISTKTLAKIRIELTNGVAAGEGIPELAKRIDDLYLAQIIPHRSTVIARTEVVASSNWSAVEAAKSSGLTLKKVWLSTSDDRTRPDHVEANGQEVAMDEPFVVGGAKLMQPGDSSLGAPADEIIQCRCTVYFKRVKETNVQAEEKRIASLGDIDTPASKDAAATYGKRVRAGREAYRKFMDEVLI